MLHPYTRGYPTELHDVAADLDVELLEQQLAHGPAGDAGDGLAGAGALQDVARVLAVVLEDAREVGVPRAGPRDLAPARLRGDPGLRGHHVLPVLPVAVPHEHRDGGAERLARPHAGEPLDLLRLDLHARAPAVPAHPPLQLAVDPFGPHPRTARA